MFWLDTKDPTKTFLGQGNNSNKRLAYLFAPARVYPIRYKEMNGALNVPSQRWNPFERNFRRQSVEYPSRSSGN